MPAPSTLTSTGALIAEFGGKVYTSTQHATFDEKNHCEDRADRTVIVGITASLTCNCGASTQWSLPASSGHKVVCRRYFRCAGTEVDPDDNYLTIVRTAAPEPPCAHWAELPLTMSEDDA